MAARIVILAGGTGGHVYPALAVAAELRARGCEVTWMGTRAGLEARVVPAAGIPIQWLSVSGFRGKGLLGRAVAPLKLLLACAQAGRLIRRLKPDVVLGMGGFVAGPGGLMAKLLGVPLVVHEQNRIPGTTNRILVKWAKLVLEAFPGSFPAALGARCVGNPLRNDIAEAGFVEKSPSGEHLKILVVGGSQGAQALNRLVPEGIAMTRLPIHIRHQTGRAMHGETTALYERLGLKAEVVSFIEDMASAYRWADLAICRSGAMTVSELAAFGLPAILVPFPFAIDDHQTANARYLGEAGAAILLPQAELSAERLAEELSRLSADPARIQAMSRASRESARLDATRLVADLCLAEAAA